MTTSAIEDLKNLRWGILEAIRNRVGLTREEARRIFNQFRGRSPDPETGDPEKPNEPETQTSPDMREVSRYMRETNHRLDHIEKDLEYLKKQVDRVLERL